MFAFGLLSLAASGNAETLTLESLSLSKSEMRSNKIGELKANFRAEVAKLSQKKIPSLSSTHSVVPM
jgi:hypothetical protein